LVFSIAGSAVPLAVAAAFIAAFVREIAGSDIQLTPCYYTLFAPKAVKPFIAFPKKTGFHASPTRLKLFIYAKPIRTGWASIFV
jgi:hypothetical protein